MWKWMASLVVVAGSASLAVNETTDYVKAIPVGLAIVKVADSTVSAPDASLYIRAFSKVSGISYSVPETVNRRQSMTRASAPDVVSIVEALARRGILTRALTSTESVADAVSRRGSQTRSVTSSESLIDAVSRSMAMSRDTASSVVLSDGSLYIRGFRVVATDVLGVFDVSVSLVDTSPTTTYRAMSNAVRTRFKTLVEDAIPIAVQYSNEVEASPEDAAWIRFDVVHSDTQLLAVGGMNTYRKNAEAIASIHSPDGQGDGSLRSIADTVVDAFAHINATGVQYRSPYMRTPRRDGRWWVADVVIPLYIDHTEVKPSGSVPTLDSTKVNVGNILRAWFNTQITTSIPIPTSWDNAPFSPPEDAKWCRMTILEGQAFTVGGGAKVTYRTPGNIHTQIFVPHGEGDFDALDVSDQITQTFRGNNIGGIRFSTPSVHSVGRRGKDPWWQLNVICPFSYDKTTA